MKHFHAFKFLMLLLSASFFSGCGIQSIPRAKNNTDATLSEITNQYKRRADLVPNLVATVKGYAKHESETLEEVTRARAAATQMTLDPASLTPQKLAEFQKNQTALSQALGRLLVVAEKYPDLKANQNFLELQAQLEGTENRITVARQRHIEAIRAFNDLVTVPPTSWTNSLIYHHTAIPQWDVGASEKEAIQKAPEVGF